MSSDRGGGSSPRSATRRLRAAAVVGLGLALLVTHFADAQLHIVQAFLAVVLLSWLALAVALTERERAVTERERLREGTTEKLDEARHRVAQLTARAGRAERGAARRPAASGGPRRGDPQFAGRERPNRTGELGDGRTRPRRGGAAPEPAGRRPRAGCGQRRDRVQRALEGELESARAEQARTSEQLAAAMSDRQRVEQELGRLGARFERVRGELERTQRAHGQANEALEQGRARFAEQRRGLEGELESARAEQARTSEQLAAAMSDRQRVEQELALGARSRVPVTRRRSRRRSGHQGAAARPRQSSTTLTVVVKPGPHAGGAAPLLRSRQLALRHRGTCLDARPPSGSCSVTNAGQLMGVPAPSSVHVEERPRLAQACATRSDGRFEAAYAEGWRLRLGGGELPSSYAIAPLSGWWSSRRVRDGSDQRTATQSAGVATGSTAPPWRACERNNSLRR